MDPMTVSLLLNALISIEQAYRAYAKAAGMSEEEQAKAIVEARKKLAARPVDALKEV